MYNLAKVYYEHYGNLSILASFKTINGYEKDDKGISLGSWINTQRKAYSAYRSEKITENHIFLLDSIGMIWISPKKDQKLQYEKIDESNFTRKNIELLNRMRTYLNNFDDSCSSSKEEIEQGFLEQLNTSPRKNNMRLCFIMNNNLNLYFPKLEDY